MVTNYSTQHMRILLCLILNWYALLLLSTQFHSGLISRAACNLVWRSCPPWLQLFKASGIVLLTSMLFSIHRYFYSLSPSNPTQNPHLIPHPSLRACPQGNTVRCHEYWRLSYGKSWWFLAFVLDTVWDRLVCCFREYVENYSQW